MDQVPNNGNINGKKFDLYDEINGEWEKQYKLPSHESEWGTFMEISKTVNDRLKSIIALPGKQNQKKLSHSTQNELDIMKSFNKLFLNITNDTDEIEAMAIYNILKLLGLTNKSNDKSNIGYILGLLDIFSMNPMFIAYANSDPKDTEHIKLTMSFPSLTLPDRIYYVDDSYSDYVDSYTTHINSIFATYSKLLQARGLQKEFMTDFMDSKHSIGRDVIEVETLIARSLKTVEQKKDIDLLYNRTTVLSFIDSVKMCNNDDGSDCTIAQKIWNNYFDIVHVKSNQVINNLDNKYPLAPGKPEEIIVYDMAYFQKLTEILMKVPIEKLIKFLAYRVISGLSTVTIRAFDDANHDFYKKKLNGQKEKKPREYKIHELTDSILGESLGRVYVESYFGSDAKQVVKNMTENIMNQMKISIETNTWMGSKTKTAALLKLKSIRVKIGYPDKHVDRSSMLKGISDRIDKYEEAKKGNDLRNASTLTELLMYARMCYFRKNVLEKIDTVRDDSVWSMDPQTVNAYYDPQLNEIVFPAAILTSPIFDISNSAATNYGSIGVIIAHEITHGFDDQGRKYDHNGNSNNWWTDDDRNEFNQLAQKMIDQYSVYEEVIISPDTDSNDNNSSKSSEEILSDVIGSIFTSRMVKLTNCALNLSDTKDQQCRDNTNTNANVMRVNGTLTLGENIADLGGVCLSYRAFLETNKGASEYDKKQFFESYALLWRKKMTPNKLMSRLLSDCHSPNRYRVWIVRNMDEFYEVYDISKDSPMYLCPEDRIKMY
jgi:putative endopeptidase